VSIYKSVQADAPYSSGTFNANNDQLVGASGVLSGGLVTTASGIVTVAPITWIQNGLIVTSDQPLTVALPGSITAPYFVAVTTSSPIENPAEVITPTFVKRPEDVSAGTVLVAQWDGQEWRPLPLLSPGPSVGVTQMQTVAQNLVGIASGFDIEVSGSNIVVGPGAAFAADGSFVGKQASTSFAIATADANGLDRIDEVVLRKPLDSPTRIATLQYLVGSTFNESGTVQLFTPQVVDASGAQAARILNSLTTDNLYLIAGEGTSPNVTLKYFTAPNATTTPTEVVTIASGVDTYDAILNPNGTIDIVYVIGQALYYQQINTAGTTTVSQVQIYSNLNVITTPKLVSVTSGSSYYLHLVFNRQVAGLQWQMCYMRLTSVGAIETNFQVLVDLSAELMNPSLAKDDDDSTLYLAFENETTAAVYLYTYDASTATALDAPTQLGLPVTLQTDVYDLSTDTELASSGATNAKVVRTANKQTYVFWRHTKGGGTYGVAVWNANYTNTFGHAALVTDLYTSGENVDQYAVSVDSLGTAHFLLREQGLAGAANLILSNFEVSASQEVLASGVTDVSTKFDSLGSLVHSYCTSSGTSIVKSTAGLLASMRDRYMPPSDVYFAHYRQSDGALSVAGTAIEEDPSIARLYEFGNIFAATGSAIWGGSSTHLLTFVAPITINVFDRFSTYTIAAQSLTVNDGYVCYIELPDEDAPATLAVDVIEFGDGILDRYGRKTIPLFWSIAGVLYSKFAPYRMEAGGQTTIIGQPLSAEQQAWLGLPNAPIDPTNHGYSSDVYVTQDMDYNEAIGRLDAAIAENAGGGEAILEGTVALPLGTTSVDVYLEALQLADTYRVVVKLENTADTLPRFQDVVVTSKINGRFTVSWNVALDTGNYLLNYRGILEDTNSAVVPLTTGTTSQVVTLPAARAGTTYSVGWTMENLTDASPQYQPVTITNKTTTGFTATWNVALDSGNYALDYVIVDNDQQTASLTALTTGTTSQVVSFTTDMPDTNYCVFPTLENTVDGSPQFQPLLVTNKTLSGYTVTWNAPLDSGNYYLETQMLTIDLDGVQDAKILANTNNIAVNAAAIAVNATGISRLDGIVDAIIGTAAQVSSGVADYDTITGAQAAFPAGAKFLILNGVTITDSPTLTKQYMIEGKGYGSQLTGNLTVASTALRSIFFGFRITGNITFNAGADKCFMTNCYQDSGYTFSNDPSNVDNSFDIITG
jgi:hypothetical protein